MNEKFKIILADGEVETVEFDKPVLKIEYLKEENSIERQVAPGDYYTSIRQNTQCYSIVKCFKNGVVKAVVILSVRNNPSILINGDYLSFSNLYAGSIDRHSTKEEIDILDRQISKLRKDKINEINSLLAPHGLIWDNTVRKI